MTTISDWVSDDVVKGTVGMNLINMLRTMNGFSRIVSEKIQPDAIGEVLIRTIHPIDIYAKAIQSITTWIIPFAFVAYLPASYFFGVQQGVFLSGTSMVIGIDVFIAIVFGFIVYMVFNRGIQICEGVGN